MTRFLARIVGIVILASAIVNHPAQFSALAERTLSSVTNAATGAIGSSNESGPSTPQAAPVKSVTDEVRFTATDGARPVVWDTCEIVPVLVNPGTLGDEGYALIKRGVAELAALTGVRFTVTGVTDAVPTTRWYVDGGTAGAEGFAPVIVAVVDRDQTDMLARDAVGSAVANPAGQGSDRRLVTGAVVLAADSMRKMQPGFKNGSSWGTTLMHELGHLAGLDHAPGGLMAVSISGGMQPKYSPSIRNVFNAYRPRC